MAKIIKKIQRKILMNMLSRSDTNGLKALGEKKLFKLFKKAPYSSTALKDLLQKKRINTKNITTIEEFSALDFTMSKENSFNKYSLKDLCRKGALDNLSNVITSSGHSGNFAFGLSTWKQNKAIPDLMDLALQSVFQIDEKKTLLVNCLPMGVRFPSNRVTQAEVSVREDMALSLIKKFSPYYDQVIIVCDPLFLKLLMDETETWKIDWSKIHKHLIIGEETFGENYRNYIGKKLHINPDDPSTGIIGSSMGVGELGLNLCFESLESIALRRTISENSVLMNTLFGCESADDPLPMLFTYNPLSTYMENKEADKNGYGQLLVSLLNEDNPIPFFRYNTGDEVKFLSNDDIIQAFQEQNLPLPKLPKMPLICVRGRDKDRLSNGLHIGAVKDGLYENPLFADNISGAFRIERNKPEILHIQLRRGLPINNLNPPDIRQAGKVIYSVKNIKLWTYDDFPYGKSIDYERKFAYLV